MNKYAVEFKGTKEGVTIYCLEGADFTEILSDLAAKLRQRASFFGDAEVSIDLGNRELTEEEREALITTVTKNSRLRLKAFIASEKAPSAKRRGRWKMRRMVLKMTLAVSGRSSIYPYPGHVIVLGDVNRGGNRGRR